MNKYIEQTDYQHVFASVVCCEKSVFIARTANSNMFLKHKTFWSGCSDFACFCGLSWAIFEIFISQCHFIPKAEDIYINITITVKYRFNLLDWVDTQF